jgi:hypothetical protein
VSPAEYSRLVLLRASREKNLFCCGGYAKRTNVRQNGFTVSVAKPILLWLGHGVYLILLRERFDKIWVFNWRSEKF